MPPQPQWQQPAAPQGYAPPPQAPQPQWGQQPAAPQGYAPQPQAPQPQWGQQPAAPQGYPPQGYPPQGGQQGYPQGYGVAPATGRRPGGLTALAVLNFVFGGLAVLGIIINISTPWFEVAARVVGPVLYFMLFLDVVGATLLILSGIGYLGQKKVLGKVMGTVYGGVVILNFILAVAVVGSFAILGILGIAYAVLTVVLLNTVFRNSFTR